MERTSPCGFCPQGPRHQPGRSHLRLPLQSLTLEPARPPVPVVAWRPEQSATATRGRWLAEPPPPPGAGRRGHVRPLPLPAPPASCFAVLPQGGAALPVGQAGRGPPALAGPLGRPAGLRCRSRPPAWPAPVPKPCPLFPPGRRSTAPWTRAPHPRARRRPPTSTRPWACMTPRTTSLCGRQVSAAAGSGWRWGGPALAAYSPFPTAPSPGHAALWHPGGPLLTSGVGL